MVGVENDGNAVDGSDGADVVGGSNGAGDGSLLLLSGVLHALAGEVGSATLAGLETVWTSIPSRALGFVGGAFYMMGAFASLAASRAATTVLERDSQLVSFKKTDPGCLDQRVDALGCPPRAIWNQQFVCPPNAGLVSVQMPFGLASSQYHMRAGAGKSGRGGVRTNLELVTLQAGMANCFSRA